MLKQGVKKQSSFLQRFQGKQNKIMKGGFLEMLNHKNSQILQQKIQLSSRKHFKQQSETQDARIQKGRSQSHQSYKNLPKQNSRRSQILTKNINIKTQNAEQSKSKGKPISVSMILSSKLKLPTINRSESQKEYELSNNLSKIKIRKQYSMGSPSKAVSKMNIQYAKVTDNKKAQLNQYVMLHLQYLQRFQKQLIYTKLSQGKKLNYQ